MARSQTVQNWDITHPREWSPPLFYWHGCALRTHRTGLFLKQPANLHIPTVCCHLNFSIMVQAHLWPSAHKSTNAHIPLRLFVQHLHPPQVKGEQNCPYILRLIFLWADFDFFSYIVTFPSMPTWISQALVWIPRHHHQHPFARTTTPTTHHEHRVSFFCSHLLSATPCCQHQQLASTMSTGWTKTSLHLFMTTFLRADVLCFQLQCYAVIHAFVHITGPRLS